MLDRILAMMVTTGVDMYRDKKKEDELLASTWCRKCGEAWTANAKFCATCGGSIACTGAEFKSSIEAVQERIHKAEQAIEQFVDAIKFVSRLQKGVKLACSHCNAIREEGQRFCNECGKELVPLNDQQILAMVVAKKYTAFTAQSQTVSKLIEGLQRLTATTQQELDLARKSLPPSMKVKDSEDSSGEADADESESQVDDGDGNCALARLGRRELMEFMEEHDIAITVTSAMSDQEVRSAIRVAIAVEHADADELEAVRESMQRIRENHSTMTADELDEAVSEAVGKVVDTSAMSSREVADAFAQILGDHDIKASSEDEDEMEDESDETDLNDLDRDGLKALILDQELDVMVTKSMSDDDIREAIREAVAADAATADTPAGDEEDDEDADDEIDLEAMDRDELKAFILEHELNVVVTKSVSDDDIRTAIKAALVKGE